MQNIYVSKRVWNSKSTGLNAEGQPEELSNSSHEMNSKKIPRTCFIGVCKHYGFQFSIYVPYEEYPYVFTPLFILYLVASLTKTTLFRVKWSDEDVGVCSDCDVAGCLVEMKSYAAASIDARSRSFAEWKHLGIKAPSYHSKDRRMWTIRMLQKHYQRKMTAFLSEAPESAACFP